MVKKREFTSEEEDLLIRLYLDGVKQKDIKKELRCSQETLIDFLKNHNLKRESIKPSKKRLLTKEEESIVKEMCANDNTIKEICKAISCCYAFLMKYIKENNIIYNKKQGAPPKITNDEFLYKLSLVTDTIIPLEKYIKRSVKINFKCLSCGHIWLAQPGNILNGEGCPMCHGGHAYTHDEFIYKVNRLNTDIEILGTYKGVKSYIECRCKICGNVWNTRATNILKGCGCPSCKESIGEKKIRNYLESHSVKFETQYKFSDCKRIKPLPFDFYLPDMNIVIEYDGQQHFNSVDIFGGEDRYEYTRENDSIKTKYCEDNNIILIRIPYYEFDNINTILDTLFTIQND